MKDQMLSLILSMNETSEIIVQSPCGKGDPFSVKRIVKQGTVTGPQLCKVSTAEYGSNTPGFQVGAVNVKPPIFVDDIMSLNMDIADMRDPPLSRTRVDLSRPFYCLPGLGRCVLSFFASSIFILFFSQGYTALEG